MSVVMRQVGDVSACGATLMGLVYVRFENLSLTMGLL
jgi:hypothetical protein